MGAKGDTTARAIGAAALRLFAAKGYAALSMREIGEAVGIRPGAIYNHFATKQDILLALMVQHLTGLAEAWAAEPTPPSPEGRFDAFVRFHLRYHFSRPDEVFLSYMELRNLEPGNFEAVTRLRRSYEGTLRAILGEGMAAGRFAIADPAVQARALIAMLNGVTTWFRPDGALSAEAVQGLYLDIARRSIGLGGVQTVGSGDGTEVVPPLRPPPGGHLSPLRRERKGARPAEGTALPLPPEGGEVDRRSRDGVGEPRLTQASHASDLEENPCSSTE